jgi:radical SAM superfamily enzyme YgiQ (UPF0313 family)
MNVLFVYSIRGSVSAQRPLTSLQDFHVGLSYISSHLKSKGHATRLVVLDSESPARSAAVIESAIADWQPRVVAFTAVSTQYPFVADIAARLRARWPEIFLLIGGMHASFETANVIRDSWDAVCVGEGERPTAELLAQLDAGREPHGIANLWLKRRADGVIEQNPPRDYLQALDELPPPDREMWHPWVLDTEFTRHVIQPSRGCPYNCTYCSNHALRALAAGHYVRFRTPDAVVAELRDLLAQYPRTTDVYLQSETIAVDIKWLAELSRRFKKFYDALAAPPALTCNFRVASRFVTDEVFDLLAAANVRAIEIGLESGSERLRREVLKRTYTNDEFYRAVALARARGMSVNVYNLIGIPGETPADHEQTIEANRRVCPDQSFTCIFYPYPGTDLYKLCQREGLLDNSASITAERTIATLDLPTFSRKQIQHAYDWFEFNIYRGHRSLPFRLRKVVRKKIDSHPWMFRAFTRLLPLWHALHGRRS